MSTNATHFLSTPDSALPTPLPSLPIAVRVGTRDDIPFVDALQKANGKALGFFPRAQLEGYIDNGWVLIAEMNGSPVAYIASRDRYLKRDELGVVYQLCVSPTAQRGLVGATLIKAMFERAAYGCRLFCCWCAQDLAANKFWEAMGFQAIAFRGGSSKKRVKDAGVAGRTHIFWQKRVRAGDVSTPWWFPAKTESGAMREDRIVLPIPPGLRWSDAMPVIVAQEDRTARTAQRSPRKPKAEQTIEPPKPTRRVAVRFGSPRATLPPPEPTPVVETRVEPATAIERKREPKTPCDPKIIAAARELRDRYLEQVNATPITQTTGKYDVSLERASARAISERIAVKVASHEAASPNLLAA